MEKAKTILMMTSLVFVALCLGASGYFWYVLPSDNPDRSTFMFMSFVFAAAFVWFGANVYNLLRNKQ